MAFQGAWHGASTGSIALSFCSNLPFYSSPQLLLTLPTVQVQKAHTEARSQSNNLDWASKQKQLILTCQRKLRQPEVRWMWLGKKLTQWSLDFNWRLAGLWHYHQQSPRCCRCFKHDFKKMLLMFCVNKSIHNTTSKSWKYFDKHLILSFLAILHI